MSGPDVESSGPAGPRRLRIANRRGLHARAAARFVRLAGTFEAEITVTHGELSVPGTSIMGLMLLGAARGAEILVAASGPDAMAALDALDRLVTAGFGESN